MARFNAGLIYTPPHRPTQNYNMWVTEYSQPHDLAGSSSQSKLFQHFYPRSYSPGSLTIQGHVPLQEDYNNLGKFIRKHHMILMGLSGRSNVGATQLPLMKFVLPSEGIYVEGYVKTFEDGAKRFAVAPEYTLEFIVVKDAHSKNLDIRSSYAIRSMWLGQYIDQGAPSKVSTTTSESDVIK